MTATQTARTSKAYRGVVYGIDVLDHETGRIVPDDYVGKTRQRGRLRENQHRDTQPFSDRIVGSPHVLWEGICTDEELAEMERRFIQDVPVRPRLNVEMNEDNPHRIPKWKQIEQRHQRDRANNRKPWVPLEQRSRESLLEWDTPDGRPLPSRQPPKQWRPWQKQLLGWGIASLTLTVAGWVWEGYATWDVRWWFMPSVSGAACTAVFGWWRLGHPVRPRTWRRCLRRKLGIR